MRKLDKIRHDTLWICECNWHIVEVKNKDEFNVFGLVSDFSFWRVIDY